MKGEGPARKEAITEDASPVKAQIFEGMVVIPEGRAILGSDTTGRGRDPWERPEHEVRMHSFMIDQYPVTNDDYRRFNPEHSFAPGHGRHPVVNVTRQEAEAYARWAGKRLPTEMEWERAARGDDDRNYPWGSDYKANRANTSESGKFGTTEVDAFPDGASPFGVMDMIGNVWEWTSSWYTSYPGARRPFDYTGQQAVVRGGTCFEDQTRNRCSRRHYFPPGTRNATLGFRCAKSVE
jgi:formylglycine-generating enzyme required for sulfatase activity